MDIPVGNSVSFNANGQLGFGLVGNLPEHQIAAAAEAAQAENGKARIT